MENDHKAAAMVVPPVVGSSSDVVANETEATKSATACAKGEHHTPPVSGKHWRKIRSAVTALAAFRSRRVSMLLLLLLLMLPLNQLVSVRVC